MRKDALTHPSLWGWISSIGPDARQEHDHENVDCDSTLNEEDDRSTLKILANMGPGLVLKTLQICNLHKIDKFCNKLVSSIVSHKHNLIINTH
jgi:hypothetical protein